MELDAYAILVGLLVGGLVGFTGLGGGVLLLPLLILGLNVPPIVAVGTGAVFSALTKVGASVVHYRQGHVDLWLVGRLALGSVPGALIGVAVLAWLRSRYGEGINDILSVFIGVLLMAIPALILAQACLWKGEERPLRQRLPGWVSPLHGAVITGLTGGVLVGITSVGAGSVIIMLLLLFFVRKPPTYVGTDVFHAVILTGVTGLAHVSLGTVDFNLTLMLLLGSVPGVLLGSQLTGRVSALWLRRVLLTVVFLTGVVMVVTEK